MVPLPFGESGGAIMLRCLPEMPLPLFGPKFTAVARGKVGSGDSDADAAIRRPAIRRYRRHRRRGGNCGVIGELVGRAGGASPGRTGYGDIDDAGTGRRVHRDRSRALLIVNGAAELPPNMT